MNRRRFLTATAIALSAPLVGCLDDPTTDGNEPPERPWTPKEPIEDPAGTHHLFVENHTDSTEVAWLRVVREDGPTVVDGRYELPDGRGIVFEDVAAWETTYAIDLAIDEAAVTSSSGTLTSAAEGPGRRGRPGPGARPCASKNRPTTAENGRRW